MAKRIALKDSVEVDARRPLELLSRSVRLTVRA